MHVEPRAAPHPVPPTPPGTWPVFLQTSFHRANPGVLWLKQVERRLALDIPVAGWWKYSSKDSDVTLAVFIPKDLVVLKLLGVALDVTANHGAPDVVEGAF